MHPLMTAGWTVAGIDAEGTYVLVPGDGRKRTSEHSGVNEHSPGTG
ncbi:hypothetical protein GCM10027079_31170 [Sediminivirga luteola]